MLSCSLKHLVQRPPAHRSSVSVDCFGEFKGVGYRLLEYRMQNFNHEFHRRIIVVVKDYLEMAGLGVNIGHGIAPPDKCHFGILPLDRLKGLRRESHIGRSRTTVADARTGQMYHAMIQMSL